MVDGNRAYVDKLGQVILVRDIVPMPRYNIKRRVFLAALEELATHLVHNLPVLFLDLIFRNRVQEVARIRKTVRAQRTELGKFEV